jgi:DNA polymerase III subunit delta
LKVPFRQLERHLAGNLANAYLIAGAEPLLVEEALERVRAAGRRAGFESREVHFADHQYDWASLASEAATLSLFASRKLVEVRLRSPRPGEEGAETLAGLVEQDDRDRLLLVAVNDKLDSRAAWVKTFEEHGALVEIWPVERHELAEWIQQRAAAEKVKLMPAAAELLAERVEGNLLAASQELKRLALTAGGKEVSENDVLESVANNSRFETFDLADAALAGDGSRAFKILDGLRAEGVHPVQIAWALNRDLGALGRLDYARQSGGSEFDAFRLGGVWGQRRQARMKQAVRRFPTPRLRALLAQAAEVDSALKGGSKVEPWVTLTGFVMAVLGPAPKA